MNIRNNTTKAFKFVEDKKRKVVRVSISEATLAGLRMECHLANVDIPIHTIRGARIELDNALPYGTIIAYGEHDCKRPDVSSIGLN